MEKKQKIRDEGAVNEYRGDTAYLSLITDAFIQEDWLISPESLHTDGTASALQIVVKTEKNNCRLSNIHPMQHCVINVGNYCEKILVVKLKDINQVKGLSKQAIKLYIERRLHLALNFLFPEQAHKQKKSLPMQPSKDIFEYSLSCQPFLSWIELNTNKYFHLTKRKWIFTYILYAIK